MSHDGKLYCKHHHNQLFKSKGNFSQFGGKHEEIRARVKVPEPIENTENHTAENIIANFQENSIASVWMLSLEVNFCTELYLFVCFLFYVRQWVCLFESENLLTGYQDKRPERFELFHISIKRKYALNYYLEEVIGTYTCLSNKGGNFVNMLDMKGYNCLWCFLFSFASSC